MLAIHGHGAHGHHPIAGRDDLPGVANAIKNNNYDYGRQFVRQGYVVACPCLTPFGDRLSKTPAKQDACADTFIRMQLLGKTLMAENLRDCLWAVELLARRDEVDAERMGCIGLSLGGRMTMLTAAPGAAHQGVRDFRALQRDAGADRQSVGLRARSSRAC